MAAILLTLLSAAAAVALVVAEVRRSRTGRYCTKPLASAAFILVALSGGALGHGTYGPCIVAGLVLGAGGDVALMFRSDRAFLTGLVLFLLGHLAYVVAFAFVVPPTSWAIWPALLPLIAAGLVLRYLWAHLGPMRVPVMVYTAVITVMVVGAIAAVCVEGPEGASLGSSAAWCLLSGAVLFFVSDISVARDRFVSTGPHNRIWGLPAYYAGQLLLAWSAIV